jgi:hypothetical protein
MQTIGGSYHDMAPYYSPSFASDAQMHKFTIQIQIQNQSESESQETKSLVVLGYL